MKYTRFRMIMQFSLQCRKKTTCCEQSLENDKKLCVFKYLPQLIDILTSLIEMWNQHDAAGERVAWTTNSVEGWHYGLQAYFSGSTPNIWLFLRNLEKDSKMQKLKYVQETAGLLCSKRPRYKKIKEQMQKIRSTYEFENAVPYLRAVANFR